MAVKTKGKQKKKVWVSVYAPEILNKAFLGETIVSEPQSLIGRKMTLNMSTVTGDMRKQNMEVKFLVTGVVDHKASTEVVGTSLTNSYLKRLVRKGKSKIADSFVIKTKNGSDIRVKPAIVTNKITSSSLNTRLRLEAKSLLEELAKTKSDSELFNLQISQKIQKELKDKLSKIYPLRYVDISKMLVVNSKVEKKVAEKVEEIEESKVEAEA